MSFCTVLVDVPHGSTLPTRSIPSQSVLVCLVDDASDFHCFSELESGEKSFYFTGAVSDLKREVEEKFGIPAKSQVYRGVSECMLSGTYPGPVIRFGKNINRSVQNCSEHDDLSTSVNTLLECKKVNANNYIAVVRRHFVNDLADSDDNVEFVRELSNQIEIDVIVGDKHSVENSPGSKDSDEDSSGPKRVKENGEPPRKRARLVKNQSDEESGIGDEGVEEEGGSHSATVPGTPAPTSVRQWLRSLDDSGRLSIFEKYAHAFEKHFPSVEDLPYAAIMPATFESIVKECRYKDLAARGRIHWAIATKLPRPE